MNQLVSIQQQFANKGFTTIENVFSDGEILSLCTMIEENKTSGLLDESFAVRNFLGKNPKLKNLLFNNCIKNIISLFSSQYKVVKAIYFDKPPHANWTVSWHQDLTIAVQEKHLAIAGFSHWLPKSDYFLVQPPQAYLDDMLTIRIHLDDCKKGNGALRVVPESHYTIKALQQLSTNFFDQQVICEVERGGVLLMKPLLWHSSKRTENNQRRRVIHIELSSLDLPKPLEWSELDYIFDTN